MADTEELAEGTVTSWAGRTRVQTSPVGVRFVWLPEWTDATQGEDVERAIISIERGDAAALSHLRQALRELAEYFGGARSSFTVALDPQGSAFQRRAWAAVADVPLGETRSYREIAHTIAAPRAVRAVGAANGANPMAPFIPCHRIVGSDGRLTGYGPGLPLKQRLLVMEGAIPASESDYDAWMERVSNRMGTHQWLLGIRATGHYCWPNRVHTLRYQLLPNRVFATPADASAAGFVPCPTCFPG